MRVASFVSVAMVLLLVPLIAAAEEIDAVSVLRIINAHRSEHGLEPLVSDERLDRAAADRMRDMEEQGYWNHQAPDGTAPFVWLSLHGYRYATAGENLARGYETPKLLVEGWMESEGHRANLLSPHFRQTGIAIIDGFTTGRAAGKSIVMLYAAEFPTTVRRTSSTASQ